MRPTVGCVLLATAALAGCGDSTIATPELRMQSTKLCQLARKATDAAPTPSSAAGAQAFLAQGISVFRPELQGLRALHPSGDVAPVYATAVGAFLHELSALEAAERQLAQGGDPIATMRTLEAQLAPLEEQQDDAWRALDIPACVTH